MVVKVLYSLLASTVVAGSAWTMSTVASDVIPEGRARAMAEKYVLAPGQVLAKKLSKEKSVKKLRKAGKKKLKEGRKRLDKAADKLDDRLEELDIDSDVSGAVSDKVRAAAKLYNVCAWGVIGFAACLLLTLAFGISSFKAAVSLGIKVTLAMVFLQGMLVFAGVLVVQRLAAG